MKVRLLMSMPGYSRGSVVSEDDVPVEVLKKMITRGYAIEETQPKKITREQEPEVKK